MPRPSTSSRALGAVVAVVAGGLVALFAALVAAPGAVAVTAATAGEASAGASQPTASRPRARAEPDPLVVRLDDLTPSTLQPGEPVSVSGTVTNTSADTWTAVNLLAFRSQSPISDTVSLAASAAIDPAEYVGDRITTPGTFTTVDVLEPGQSLPFALTVPWEELGISEDAPGVYWFGVHASGMLDGVRDELADGRARTFMPLVAGGDAHVEAAFVVPVRGTVWHEPDGRIARVPQWTRSLSEGGRLESVLDVASATTESRVSWLVDPAILVAVSRLAAGNPPRSLAPDPAQEQPADGSEGEAEEGDGEEADGEGEEQTAEPAPTTGLPAVPAVPPGHEPTDEERAAQAAAAAWLERFRAAMVGQDVLALPYGDIDASAAVRRDAAMFDAAVARSRQVMEALSVFAGPALAPRDGILSAETIEAAPPETTVLLGDTAFANPPTTSHSLVRMLGHKVVVTSTGASSGGPAPSAEGDPIAVRQRLLSEASLRLAAGDTAPVVVMLPADWHPDDPTDLFGPLELPWLEPVGVQELTDRPAVSASRRDLVYNEEDLAAELSDLAFAAARRMADTAAQLEKVLTAATTVQAQVADESLTTLSYGHREGPGRGVAAADRATAHMRDQLSSIRVEVPRAVTLSSQSGPIGATVVNGIDQLVTIRVVAESEDDVVLEDLGPLTLDPESRTRIIPTITTRRLGIHDVRLVVTDVDGIPLGPGDELPVRAAQVGRLIWLVMGAGAAILLGAILVRLVRRVRHARSTS